MSGVITRPLWKTPTTQPSEYVCRRLLIPASLEWKAIVNGAVSLLTDETLFEESDGGLTVDEAHQVFMSMWLQFQACPTVEGVVMPIGSIMPFAGDLKPDGYLWCDGRPHLIADYPELASTLSSAFIVDETYFITPDLRGRFVWGMRDASDNNGDIGGEEAHTLTIDEMPSHNHVIGSPTNSSESGSGRQTPAGTANNVSGNTGGDQPHNNMPPYMILRYLIVAE